jgi:hypothetical protein
MNDEKIPDIVLIYPIEFPDKLITEEMEAFKVGNLNIAIQKVENGPYNSFEWIVPTAFGVYILKPYFDSFLSEAGKDHYLLLKKGLKKIAEKGKQISIKLITASQSTQKLSGTYNQSLVLSIMIQTKNNRRIKLLFDNDLEKEDWDNAIDEILDFVIENYEEYPNDKLNKLINIVNDDERNTIYAKINQQSKLIEFFDDKSLILEFKKKNNS